MYRIRLKSNARMVIFAILVMLFFVNSTKAQSTSSSLWTYHTQVSGVKVFYKISKCAVNTSSDPIQIASNQSSTLELKFENLDASSKAISWNSVLSANNTSTQSTVLLSLNTKEIDCEFSPLFSLKMSANATDPVSVKEALNYLNLTIVTN